MNLNPEKLVKISQNSIEPKPADIRVVDWKSFNTNENYSPKIATECNKDTVMTLYLDGMVKIKNRSSNIEEEKKVNPTLLKEKLSQRENNKFYSIKISELLEKTK